MHIPVLKHGGSEHLQNRGDGTWRRMAPDNTAAVTSARSLWGSPDTVHLGSSKPSFRASVSTTLGRRCFPARWSTRSASIQSRRAYSDTSTQCSSTSRTTSFRLTTELYTIDPSRSRAAGRAIHSSGIVQVGVACTSVNRLSPI